MGLRLGGEAVMRAGVSTGRECVWSRAGAETKSIDKRSDLGQRFAPCASARVPDDRPQGDSPLCPRGRASVRAPKASASCEEAGAQGRVTRWSQKREKERERGRDAGGAPWVSTTRRWVLVCV